MKKITLHTASCFMHYRTLPCAGHGKRRGGERH